MKTKDTHRYCGKAPKIRLSQYLSLPLSCALSPTLSPYPTPQPYEPQLFRLCVQCLAAVAKALPPDHVDSSRVSQMEKKSSTDTDGYFDPRPVDTSK